MVYRTKEHKERLNNIDVTMTRREKIGYYALLDNNKKKYIWGNLLMYRDIIK